MLSSIREDQGVKSSFDSAVSKAEQKLQVSGEDEDGGGDDDDGVWGIKIAVRFLRNEYKKMG